MVVTELACDVMHSSQAAFRGACNTKGMHLCNFESKCCQQQLHPNGCQISLNEAQKNAIMSTDDFIMKPQ